jgi:transcriptional regulator GlxA family with amidase domain
VSTDHLCHLFRDAIGMTVWQYLARVGIEVAKQLLENPADPLDGMAERVEFCNAC